MAILFTVKVAKTLKKIKTNYKFIKVMSTIF